MIISNCIHWRLFHASGAQTALAHSSAAHTPLYNCLYGKVPSRVQFVKLEQIYPPSTWTDNSHQDFWTGKQRSAALLQGGGGTSDIRHAWKVTRVDWEDPDFRLTTKFKSVCCQLPVAWPWTTYLTSTSLSVWWQNGNNKCLLSRSEAMTNTKVLVTTAKSFPSGVGLSTLFKNSIWEHPLHHTFASTERSCKTKPLSTW